MANKLRCPKIAAEWPNHGKRCMAIPYKLYKTTMETKGRWSDRDFMNAQEAVFQRRVLASIAKRAKEKTSKDKKGVADKKPMNNNKVVLTRAKDVVKRPRSRL